jgi:hypothetical protein
MNDEFFVGYEDRCPPALATWTRWFVVALAVVVVLVAVVGAAALQPAAPGRFEFGQRRNFEGTLFELPVPVLHGVGDDGGTTTYLLVGVGKRGLPEFARGHDGARVALEGTLIERGPGERMIELNAPESFRVLAPAGSGSRRVVEVMGDVLLTGELVDTKCHFGVMRPATGKVHRACAVRCLSGGVPPGLLVRQPNGDGIVVVLAGEAGRPLTIDPQWAGREVEARGRLVRDGDQARLEAREVALANARWVRSPSMRGPATGAIGQ